MAQRQSNSNSGKGTFYGWYVVGAMFFMFMLSVGGRQGFGLFFDAWRDQFGISISFLSAIAAAGWVINGLAQPVVGGLTDRFGGKVVMVVSTLVLGLGAIALSMAPNVWVLAAVYVPIVSVAMAGVMVVPATAVIARWFRRRRGAALGVFSAGASVGGMLLIPFMAFLMVLTDWRVVWMVVGGATLVLAFPLVAIIVKNSPREVGAWQDGDDEPAGGPEGDLSTGFEALGPLAVDRWKSAYRSAPMWQLTTSYIACGVTTAIISVHFVPFATDKGISTSTAALAFGLLSFLNLLGVLSVSWLSDRILRKNALGVIYAVRGLAFLMLVILPMPVGLWVFAALAGASWLASVPQTSALTAEIYGIKKAGTLNGMLNMIHQLGGAAAVLLAGITFDAFGSYTPAFLGALATLVVASVMSFTVKERKCSVRFVQANPSAGLVAEGA